MPCHLPAGCRKRFARNRHWQLPPKPTTRRKGQDTKWHQVTPSDSKWLTKVYTSKKLPTWLRQFDVKSWELPWRIKSSPCLRSWAPSICSVACWVQRCFSCWTSLFLIFSKKGTNLIFWPPSQRFRAKANKRRRKGPVTTLHRRKGRNMTKND